jgi:thiol-disulfide isomerase/thioredoxin
MAMEAYRYLRMIAIGAIGLGVGLLVLRPAVIAPPVDHGQANPAAHARDPIQLIDTKDRASFPDFGYRDEKGISHRFSDLVGKKPILVHFWATWCGPCLPELPEVNDLAVRLGERLTVFPVSLDRDALTVVRKFLDERHFADLSVIAPDPDLELPQALPTSVLVDKTGKVAWKTAGAHPWNGPDLDAALKALE